MTRSPMSDAAMFINRDAERIGKEGEDRFLKPKQKAGCWRYTTSWNILAAIWEFEPDEATDIQEALRRAAGITLDDLQTYQKEESSNGS